MARLPAFVGAIAIGSIVSGASAFAANPGDFDEVSAFVVLVGIIIVGLTGFVGLVLARAPWGRWTMLMVVGLGLILGSVGGGWMFWVALGLGSVATVGLTGPWLALWLRRSPAVDAPGPVVIMLISVASGTVLWVGLSTGSGFRPVHVALVIAAVASSRSYGRGQAWGLWALRIAVPLVGVASVIVVSGPGKLLLSFGLVATTIVAWLPHARRSTAVITPPLPAPVERSEKGHLNASE